MNCTPRSLILVLGLLFALSFSAAAAPASGYTAGQKAPAFQAKATDGKTINFPGDYKGKVVLLDFWATWCGPCRLEMPNVVAAYNEYHAKGFEVLGISLDKENASAALAQFTSANKMPWPQIFDGQFWKAAVAQQYGIHSIPRPILVDGDTGVILAEGPEARGENLGPAIKKGLEAKTKS
jgi:peroxiredoxin